MDLIYLSKQFQEWGSESAIESPREENDSWDAELTYLQYAD